MTILRGTGVCPGEAAGPVARVGSKPTLPPAPTAALDPEQVDGESARALAALGTVADQLQVAALKARVQQAREVLEATALIARDPALADAVRSRIAKGEHAPWAVAGAIESFRDMLLSLGGYLAERAEDLDDVRDRAVAVLLDRPMPGVPDRDEPFVLVAEDLAPADTATLDPAVVVALVTSRGGPTSHTAIIARALGIPAVVACAAAADLVDGDLVSVDGRSGEVVVGVSDSDVHGVREREAQRRARRSATTGPGRTADGIPVALLANIGDVEGAQALHTVGAEGVGLFRTELAFLGHSQAPSVAEQTALYTKVFAAVGSGRLVVRTLDAGADKPLPFLDMPAEPNPALGVRGLRIARTRRQVLDDQLEALAAAAAATGAQLHVMAPMVATAAEAAWFVDRAREHGLASAGVMIEVPAAALRARDLLRHCDFLSIGTNDLGQYTLAVDRMSPDLTDLLDPRQPALLDLVAMAAHAGKDAGKPVGVCGEAAADPQVALILVGLGVSSLSMSPSAVPDVRQALAETTMAECRELARVALEG